MELVILVVAPNPFQWTPHSNQLLTRQIHVVIIVVAAGVTEVPMQQYSKWRLFTSTTLHRMIRTCSLALYDSDGVNSLEEVTTALVNTYSRIIS